MLTRSTRVACAAVAPLFLFGLLLLVSANEVFAEECAAPAAWFPVTPEPDNHNPDPEEECGFYQWAWQTFLYLTQPAAADGAPRFLEFSAPSEVFGTDAMPRFAAVAKVSKPRTLLVAPRLAKQRDPVDLDSFRQANSLGVLVDQNGRAIYYSMHMNPVFEEFIRSHGYNDVAKLKDADPGEPFPRGTLELKSSWKVVAPGEDAGTYFTTQAPVPLLVQNGTKVEIDPVKTKTETLALVGLHVVGVTEGHPEFIWATFEHKDNAPDRPDALAPDSSQPIDDTRGWTFYPKGKPAKDCNINPRSAVKLADPDKQILSPTVPIFRHLHSAATTIRARSLVSMRAFTSNCPRNAQSGGIMT